MKMAATNDALPNGGGEGRTEEEDDEHAETSTTTRDDGRDHADEEEEGTGNEECGTAAAVSASANDDDDDHQEGAADSFRRAPSSNGPRPGTTAPSAVVASATTDEGREEGRRSESSAAANAASAGDTSDVKNDDDRASTPGVPGAYAVEGPRSDGRPAAQTTRRPNEEEAGEEGARPSAEEAAARADSVIASSSSTVAASSQSNENADQDASAATTTSAAAAAAAPFAQSMSIRTRRREDMTIQATDTVKSDALAIMLVECTGVPGAYRSTTPAAAAARSAALRPPPPPAGSAQNPATAQLMRRQGGEDVNVRGAQTVPESEPVAADGEDDGANVAGSRQTDDANDEDRSRPSQDDASSREGAVHVAAPTSSHPHIHHPPVIDAHVVERSDGESFQQRRRRSDEGLVQSFHTQIREHLVQNAPLVEGTAVMTMGDDVIDEERGTVANGAAPGAVSPDRRRSSASSTNQEQAVSSDGRGPRATGGKYLCSWKPRRRMLMTMALLAAALVLVLGLSIPLSRQSNDDESKSSPQDTESPPVAGDQSGTHVTTKNPSSAPTANDSMTVEPSLAPTSPPSSLHPESLDTTVWKMMGGPITGLRNESGVTLHIDHSTGGVVSFGYGPKSNMTFSGLSLAISDDGRTLVVGESGTDTVRVFRWDTEVNDWMQKGQTLKGERDCVRRKLNHNEGDPEDDPTQFLPCYLSFGFEVHISGDGAIVAVTSAGYNHQAGMVRAYMWNEEQSAWVQLGSDLIGYERNQGFGGSISLSNDGTITLAALSSQSLRPDVAAQYAVEAWNVGPGMVQVYDWNGTAWAQRGDTVFGHTHEESLGFVDLTKDGQSYAVGTILGGRVEVYDWDESLQAWGHRGESIVAPIGEDNFGSPVLFASQDGNRLIIGSNYVGTNDTEGAYLVYVYSWDGSGWVQLDRMNILQSAVEWGAHHNTRVTNDGNFLAAAFTSGVLIFEWDGSRYLSKGGTVDGGREVAISNSGEVFAVGRPGDHSLGFGLGRTTVYERA